MGNRGGIAVGVAVALVASVAGGYFAFFRTTDDSRIRAQLTKLATSVRITNDDASMNPIGRFAHVNDAFVSIFDKDVRVSIPELTDLGAGRRELAELATSAPRMYQTFETDFSDVQIKYDDAKMGALVGATANLNATERGGESRNDKRAVDFRFAKTNGEWIITSVTVWPKDEARP